MSPPRSPGVGFTLIEVLIALTIVAIGLAAAVRATTQVTAGAEDLKMRTLALWIAEDRLADHSARRSWPDPGSSQGGAEQAHVPFVWRETVAPVSEGLRSIEVEVASATQPRYVLARLMGVAAMPMPANAGR